MRVDWVSRVSVVCGYYHILQIFQKYWLNEKIMTFIKKKKDVCCKNDRYFGRKKFKKKGIYGALVAQLVERPTLGFGSGHDLMVYGLNSTLGSALTALSLLGVLSLPLSVLPTPNLKINK